MAEAFYRLKSAGGAWTRVTGTAPITVTGLTEGAVYEYLEGDGTIGEVTAGETAVQFTVMQAGGLGELIFDPVAPIPVWTAEATGTTEITFTSTDPNAAELFYRYATDDEYTRVVGTSPIVVTGLIEGGAYFYLSEDEEKVIAFDVIDIPGTFGLRDGAYFDYSRPEGLFSDVAGSTQIQSGDLVAVMTDRSGNGNDITITDVSLRPTWVEVDGVGRLTAPAGDDRGIPIPFATTGVFTFAAAFNPDGRDFILVSDGFSPWAAAGYADNPDTQIASNIAIDALYWDRTISTGTTRGDLHSAAQLATTVVMQADMDPGEELTKADVGSQYDWPGDIFAVYIREESITQSDALDLSNALLQKTFNLGA